MYDDIQQSPVSYTETISHMASKAMFFGAESENTHLGSTPYVSCLGPQPPDTALWSDLICIRVFLAIAALRLFTILIW